ncbi:MAG TPA: hypothetical protein VKB53_08435 [Gammaproteobacteria bacterium]|nr:hypothetical protein [Gammaproteobacteria bacterium]
MAAELPVTSRTVDRLPDQYIDGRPYWAPEPAILPAPVISQWEVEVGGRYWFSSGRTQKDLYGLLENSDVSPKFLNSRLTYTGLTGHSGEIFGRVEHATGFFLKGYAGGGSLPSGKLQDEDFPRVVGVYSSTNSEQRDGRLAYGTVDLGWAWRITDFKLGAFVGYHYNFQRLNAYGCTQTGGHPEICVPPFPTSVLGITEEATWNAMRLGVNFEWRFWDRFKLATEFAWLPYAVLEAKDTHWQRPDLSGATPETGSTAANVQLEAILSYSFSDALSAGIGGRYWTIGTGGGGATAHFEQTAQLGAPQALTFRTSQWGAFLQGSYKFGGLPPSNFTDSRRRF